MQVNAKHLLEGVTYPGKSPNTGGILANPTLLVIHYTASGGTGKADAEYLSRSSAKASAHVVVGRKGGSDIIQIVPFNVVAWHAGVSIWRGKSNCNGYSIGIEVDNYGYINRTADGLFHPGANAKAVIAPSAVMEARHKHPGYAFKYWEVYPPEQMEALIDITNAILAKYPSITEIVGHEDVSPGRKSDPGPAFPWNHFLANTIGRKAQISVQARVRASSLNVRGGPGTNYPIHDSIPDKQVVQIIYDVPGEWAEIKYAHGRSTTMKSGFVADRYLEKI